MKHDPADKRPFEERHAEHRAALSAADDSLNRRLLALIDKGDVAVLQTVARLYVENMRWIAEHMPEFRERVAPFACSGNVYHYCSFSNQHDPGCPAVGGDGKLTGGFSHATPCAPDCGETDEEPWCSCSGFDCPDCAVVDVLLGLFAANGVE